MKTRKNLLTLLLLFTALAHAQAQQDEPYREIFLGNHYQFYKGCLLKAKETPPNKRLPVYSYLYFQLSEDTYSHSFYFSDRDEKDIPPAELVKDREFKVTDVITPESESHLYDPVFVLQDISSGQVLYYRYTFHYANNDNTEEVAHYQPDFHFLVKNIRYTKKSARLNMEVFAYSDIYTSINTPDANIMMCKTTEKGKRTYDLMLWIKKPDNGETTRGVQVFFNDGTVYSKDVEVEYDTNLGYSAFIPLTSAELKLFSRKKIQSFKLGSHQQPVTDIFAELFPLYVKALKKATPKNVPPMR